MRVAVWAMLLALALAPVAMAQPAPVDPDWPCFQRLVPKLEAGSYWNGPAIPPLGEWRNDQAMSDVVDAVTARGVSDDAGVSALTTYADQVPVEKRASVLPLLFGAIVQETNSQRDDMIGRIDDLGRRQRAMGATVAKLSTDAEAPGIDAQTKLDRANQRDFALRAFTATQQTMRYACDEPAALERRLGAYAKVLQAKLAAGPPK